jgi:hypothetical protein
MACNAIPESSLPSAALASTRLERSCRYLPANGLLMTAAAATLRSGGSPGNPASCLASSISVTILRIRIGLSNKQSSIANFRS